MAFCGFASGNGIVNFGLLLSCVVMVYLRNLPVLCSIGSIHSLSVKLCGVKVELLVIRYHSLASWLISIQFYELA